jgi:acid phosphatase class B
MKRIFQALAVVCLLALLTVGARAQGTNQYGSLSAASTDCATASQCVTLQIPNNTSSVAIDLDGTFVATLQFESQGAPGGTWRAIKVTPIASTTT